VAITLRLFSILGCALMAGVFFAFSTFVMNALSRLTPSQGIAAMQSINITAINPLFMTTLFGTAATSIFFATSSLSKLPQTNAVYLLSGSLFYLIGTIGVTIIFNIPLNDSLAKISSDSIEGEKLWVRYLTDWTFWNHIRTLTSLVAALLFTLAKPIL
jgi:uncharacterized membrane protein